MNMSGKSKHAGAIAGAMIILAALLAGLAFSEWNSGWGMVDPAWNGMDMLTVPESYWRDEHTGEPKQPQPPTIWDYMRKP